jgi:hypothetical protein
MRKGVIKGGFEREPWFPSLEARRIRKNLRILRVQNLGLSNGVEKIIDITLAVEKDKTRNNRANKYYDGVAHEYLKRFLLFF